jgi:hypothetical protein
LRRPAQVVGYSCEVASALQHELGAKKSDRQIAEHVGVDQKTVAHWRKELEATEEIPQSDEREGKDGRVINVSKIKDSNKAWAETKRHHPQERSSPTVEPGRGT